MKRRMKIFNVDLNLLPIHELRAISSTPEEEVKEGTSGDTSLITNQGLIGQRDSL